MQDAIQEPASPLVEADQRGSENYVLQALEEDDFAEENQCIQIPNFMAEEDV